MNERILTGSCLDLLPREVAASSVDVTFFDPPFNQDKIYDGCPDDIPAPVYWKFITEVLNQVFAATARGGSIYFMQREKNAALVIKSLEDSGWTFQNMIIWKKMTSATPSEKRYGKSYQIIVFATKGEEGALVFNKLRIDPPRPVNHKVDRENGVLATDCWDDIRELTSGFYAGDEAMRSSGGDRFHLQQAPVALLLRVLLSSTLPGDNLLDPFAGTGTGAIVAKQLGRRSISMDLSPVNTDCIGNRLKSLRPCDNVERYYPYYRYTDRLPEIWGVDLGICSSFEVAPGSSGLLFG